MTLVQRTTRVITTGRYPSRANCGAASVLLWKHELDKLAAAVSEAEAYLNMSDSTNATSKDHQPPSCSVGQMGMVNLEKVEKACRANCGAAPTRLATLDNQKQQEWCLDGEKYEVVHEDSDRRFSRKRLKGSKGMYSMVQEASGTEIECSRRHKHGSEREHDGSMKMFSAQNHKGLINWEIVQHDHVNRHKVMEVLYLFKEEYVKRLQQRSSDFRAGNIPKYPHLEAARRVKEMGMNIYPDKPFGHIPGIMIGDEFSFRAELGIVGLNCQLTRGIDYVNLGGNLYATSVVNSWRYENETKGHGSLIYTGEGGNPETSASIATAADQKPVRGNLALINNIEKGYPVRVIHKRKCSINIECDYYYVYDGLYIVNKFWQQRDDKNLKLVFKFELMRLPGQPSSHGTDVESGKCIRAKEFCNGLHGKENLKVVNEVQRQPRSQGADIRVLDDISLGIEKSKVPVFNGLDGDRPLPFTYLTSIPNPPYLYQHCEPVVCNCIEGCSNSVQCPCVIKNGGKIPFTEKGELLRETTNKVVHECGPSCKCPPSCMNRMSQNGPQFQLEVFKTKLKGWGVRSRDYIMPGSFVCEYIGELLGEKEVNQGSGKDEYLFDICQGDFALDAANYGNIARFINHSCDPNMVFHQVLYDHDDKRIPHIMFFASKRIPPKKELTYDYKRSKIHVCDMNKRKTCNCGSGICTGRLYQ